MVSAFEGQESSGWLWEPFITYGKVTIIFSDYAIDATRLMFTLAARMTKGMRLHLVKNRGQNAIPENVFYLAPPDMVEDTGIVIFRRAGGDDSRLAYFPDINDVGGVSASGLTKTVTETGAKLLVIDTIECFRPAKVGLDNPDALRRFCVDMQRLAQNTEAAVVLISDVTRALYEDGTFSWYKNAVSRYTDSTLMLSAAGDRYVLEECHRSGETVSFFLDDERDVVFSNM